VDHGSRCHNACLPSFSTLIAVQIKFSLRSRLKVTRWLARATKRYPVVVKAILGSGKAPFLISRVLRTQGGRDI
jgi:hypothetical protein